MSASPEKADAGDGGTVASENQLNELEMQTALLRSIVKIRPVGPHKHVLMIQLQAELYDRTQIWLSSTEIWDRIDVMFDVAALDSMAQASPPPLPDSPKSLSPLPESSRHKTDDISVSPSSTSPRPSKSAQLINSSHFGPPFTLPYFRLGQEHWKINLADDNTEGNARRSRSVAYTSTRTEADTGFMLKEGQVEMSLEDERDWQIKIYEENGRATKGVDQEAEDRLFVQGIEGQLAAGDKAEEQERLNEAKSKPKRKPGRPSKARKEKEDTSDLSDAAGDAQEEEEEEEAPKATRTKRANAGKRKRDSTTKEESEDEKEVKETPKTRRKRK